MSEHDEVVEWDAAYVLGSLSPADRRRFESHLQDCERCRQSVAELGALPGLLSRAPHPPVVQDSIPEPPLDLLRKTRERHLARRRRRTTRIFALAAAAGLALVLAIGVPLTQRPQAPAVLLTLQPVSGQPMTAQVGMDQVAWGTRLKVNCDYPQGYSFGDENEPWSYALMVTDTAGATMQVSTWKAVPGREITLEAATSLAMDQISEILVQTQSGEEVLRAPVPKS